MTAESWRVAQVVVEPGPGDDGSRGSGYLVAPGRVLSAAHLVAEASVVRVRLDVDQPTEIDVLAKTWWADPEGHNGSDLAVVTIPEDATAGRHVELAQFGRISDGTAELAVQAFGFPRFKLRPNSAGAGRSGVFRDLEQVTGHVPVAANRRQGTLAVYLDDPPPAAPEPGGASPWAGMSGATVWTANRIIGIIAEHHLGEGTGRLTARRIDRAYEMLSKFDVGRLMEWLGLPPTADGLPDVIPVQQDHIARSQATEMAEFARQMLKVVGAEVTDCPGLFTVTPEHPVGTRRLRFSRRRFRLTLWCEQPGCWHPLTSASYRINPPKEWFVRIQPYAALILRRFTPAVSVQSSPGMDSELQLMRSLISELPNTPTQDFNDARSDVPVLTPVEGEALRAFRVLLFEIDPLRSFGGLRRVLTPSTGFLWVCRDHYYEYKLGMPTAA